MCGFALDFSRTAETSREALIQTVLHRGPDDTQSLSLDGGTCTISFCRLAIRDIKEGAQPLVNESFISCFNGELYNQSEIENRIKDLDSNVEIPKGDMNVLAVYLYLTNGDGITNAVGMFSGFIFFRNLSKVMLFRDRTGEKPIFYKLSESHFSILSEHRFAEDYREIPVELTVLELVQGFWESQPHKSVTLCPPGSVTTISLKTGAVSRQNYWSWSSKLKEDEPFSLVTFESILTEVIKSQLTSDVSLALLLSSGVDSSLVASYAQELSKERIAAYTLDFHDKSWSESTSAENIASFIGLEHRTIQYSYEELAYLIPKVIEAMDLPIFDPATISLYALCKEVGIEYKVAIGGDGGDELTRGYDLVAHEQDLLRARKLTANLSLPKSLSRSLMQLNSGGYNSLRMKLGRVISVIENRHLPLPLIALSPFSGTAALDKLIKSMGVEQITHESYSAEDYYRKKILPEVYLLKSDRMSMANSLELRSPYLDKRLLEYTSRVSEKEHRLFGRKSFLGALAKKRFPEELIQKRKHGFSPPLMRILEHVPKPDWNRQIEEIFGDDADNIWKLARTNQNYSTAAWALMVCNYFMCGNRLQLDGSN